MIGTIVAAALWALAASLVFSSVLGALVAGAIAFARPAAATRQMLWTVALGAAGFAPVAILAVMLVRGATPAPAPAKAPVVRLSRTPAPAAGKNSTLPVPAAAPAPAPAFELRVPGPPGLTPIIAGSVVGIWALGALIGLIGLGRSIARVRGLKGRSSPLDGVLATELPWLTTTAGREIYLRLSYETETPIAVGFRRPVILLPTEMATADGLTSIEPLIMHEYAHLARYDDWTNLAQRATERLFWFNPLVWILGRRIALEREVAADEAVVARTHDAKQYATTLWRMAQEMRMPEHVVVAPGAMLTRKQISVRIERLLEENPVGQRHVGAAAFAIVVVAATGVAGLAASAPPIALTQATVAAPLDVTTPDVKIERPAPAKPAPAAVPVVAASPAPPPPAPSPAAAPKIAMPPHRSTALHHKVIVIQSDDDAKAYVKHMPEAGDVMKTFETERLSQRIQADVQRKLADAFAGRDFSRGHGTKGPMTRDLVAHCLGCDYSHRDLSGLDLSNLSIIGADFSYATLRGVNLHGAKLTGVDFTHAILDDADLSDASLRGVDLRHASMQNANTSGIQLIGSSLP